ncbi:MAG: glycosyltransferase family 92 protein, partial [Acidiphilium sp.]|nr:glycosyltransferase family 92 protein [Acidiphilium sp.]
MKLACVAIVKNEQNHVAEWIAYQLAIGFDTVIIFDNQSTDDTAARIRAFAPDHDVRLHEWTMTTPDYQTRCYEHAARSYTDEFDWLAFFDIDEFLVLDPGFDLKSILNLFPATPAIGVPWAMFGSSGHTEKPDGLLIEAFTHRSEPSFGPNRHIKSIIRPKHMLYCHNAHSFAMDGQYRSLTGKPLTFTQGGLLDTDPDYTLGKLHHYFTRSRAHWADKMQRGYHDTSREDSEFEAYDRNEIPDDSARDLAPRVREILANLGTATAQHAPTFISPPAQSPNPQASPSFLKERSKELSPESIRRPGEWALLTEFGTLLCWHPPTRALSHRPPSNLADHTLLLWRCGDENELIATYAGHPETIDPITGHMAPPAIIPKLTPIPGLEPGDIAFKLANGAHLSAREAAAPGEPGLVDAHVAERKAWECFTPIPPAAAADLIDLASSRWIIGEIPESPLAATPRGRQHFAVGHRTYAIAESLPLSNVIRYPSGTISSAILTREGWQLDELRRFRPLIVFTLFDRTQDADRLRIAAQALHYLADYSGDCLVIGDQPPAVVAPLFPEPLRRNLHVHEIAGNSSTHAQTHQSPSPSSLGATLILPDLDLFN